MRRKTKALMNNGQPVQSDADAITFINERGIVPLSDIRKWPLPSLSAAFDRPVDNGWIPDACWRWKEVLPGRQLCAYGKFLRSRGAFISWELFPCFYALFGPSDAINEEYAAVPLGWTERVVLDFVIAEGPVDSRAMWKELRHVLGERSVFVRALEQLQVRYILTVSGGSIEGWSLHEWDLITRQAPAGVLDSLPDTATAQACIFQQLAANATCLPTAVAASVLHLTRNDAHMVATRLLEEGLITAVEVESEPGTYWAVPSEW